MSQKGGSDADMADIAQRVTQLWIERASTTSGRQQPRATDSRASPSIPAVRTQGQRKVHMMLCCRCRGGHSVADPCAHSFSHTLTHTHTDTHSHYLSPSCWDILRRR